MPKCHQYKLSNLDSDNSDSISTSLEFYDFIKELLLSNFDIACTNIYNNIHNDNIHIYRAITVDDDWIEHLQKQGRRLGIYWSYESNGAITHWGNYNKPKTAFITAIINQKYVDWKTTLELNTDPVYSEEKEIRLYKNTPIKILDITVLIKINNISFSKIPVYHILYIYRYFSISFLILINNHNKIFLM